MAQVDSESSTAMPAGDAGALFRRTDISPETFFVTLGRARKAAADEIERLIQWLDSTIDVDEDCAADDEPCDGDGDLEPALGSFDSLSNQIKAWSTRDLMAAQEDRELDDCDREEGDHPEDGADAEPSLLGVTANGHMTDNDLEADVMDSQQGSTPARTLAAARERDKSKRSNVRRLDGSPVDLAARRGGMV